jgi:hypothetical protein
MANDSKRVSQLGVTTSISANDRIMVLTNPGAAGANVQTISVNAFSYALANTTLPIANSTARGVVSVDGVYISAAANGQITVTNTPRAMSSYETPLGSNNGVSSGNFSITATPLRVNTQIQYLSANGDSGQQHFYLPTAANGTMIYFIVKTPMHSDDIVIWVNSARKMGQTSPTSPAAWVPFYYGTPDRNLAKAIYLDGAWNFDTNNFYL